MNQPSREVMETAEKLLQAIDPICVFYVVRMSDEERAEVVVLGKLVRSLLHTASLREVGLLAAAAFIRTELESLVGHIVLETATAKEKS